MLLKNKFIILIVFILMVIAATVIFLRTDDTIITEEKREINLYFSTRNAMYLQAEKRQVDPADLYQQAIEELIKGPESDNLHPTIPEGVKLLNVRVEDETAYLDFNMALIENHWGGSTGETLTVFSIVNTMAQFSEVKDVQILIEGQTVETLAGHMYLLNPLEPSDELLKKNN